MHFIVDFGNIFNIYVFGSWGRFYYKTDEVTLSNTSFFRAAEIEFFRLGRVPPKVTSGHPLFNRRSTSSWEPEVRA